MVALSMAGYSRSVRSISTIIAMILLFPLVAGLASAAPDQIISNSADWRDVYSTMVYGNIQGIQTNFLTGPPHATVLLYSIPADKSIQIVSSRSNLFVAGYKGIVEGQGFTEVEEIQSDNINLDLAQRIGVDKFIVIDDAYGYNAIAVAPYAVVSKSYVIFANNRNARQVERVISAKGNSKVLIYGQVDANVKTQLAKFNPDTINTGDRFDNNVEIVKRYLQIKQTKQAILSNGEFIEQGIMSGSDPVLFIGRDAVPDQIKNFMKQSGIDVAILIGNELIGTATEIRRQVGVSVFVKFAQGARVPSGTITAVEDLDRFPMPRYGLRISIYSIQYNRATKSLEVTFKNDVNLGAYLKSTITLLVEGDTYTIGDETPVYIDKNQYKTFVYSKATDGRALEFADRSFNATVYTLFGESRRALENVLTGSFIVQSVEILDGSILNITSIVYDRAGRRFMVTLENIGTVDAYATAELQDLFINGEYLFVSSDGSTLIRPGKKATIYIPQDMTDDDIYNNQVIKLKVYYGERPQALIKQLYGEYDFKEKGIDYIVYGLIFLLVVLVLIIIFWRKKCKECGTKNSPLAKRCRKCHALLRSKPVRRKGD